MKALLSLLAVLASPFAHPQATPSSCIRYVYADAAGARDNRMPIHACRDIVNNKATNCTKIGELDVRKVEEAKKRALEKMWAFSRGVLAGYSCQLGTMALPMAMRGAAAAGSSILMVDRRTAKNRMATCARDRTLAGTREPGSTPNEDCVVETGVTQACAWIRHNITANTRPQDIDGRDAYNLGVDTALSHFRSSAAITAVLHGDAQALEEMYKRGTIEHREAVRRFHAKIEEERKRQEAVLKKVVDQASAFYRFMMDTSLTTIAFGYSAEGVSNDLPCVAPDAITKARTKLCELARATAKMEAYVPGDVFESASQRAPANAQRQLADADQRTRAWVEANCKPDVAGTPGIIEKSEPGLPVPPTP